MELQIYNSLTHRKETFTPIVPGQVSIYLCGPTVYGLAHIGNFRGPIFFNFVRHFLERLKYKVTFVYNYTDVDDKIIEAANKRGISAQDHALEFTKEFKKDFDSLGLTPHTHNPTVTGTMKEIISMIEELVQKGKAYQVAGDVYFSVSTSSDYGKLSHKNIEELQAGIRVEIGDKKRSPVDFALWKAAKPGEPSWESPWGAGRPGWHIECSAMAKKILGKTIDIHGGGIDLIFPHHENEIAQSEGANEAPFVHYWMHNNFINMGKDKMSKSIGNTFFARNFIETYNPEILKFLILSSHYRSPSDFSHSVISHSVSGLSRIYSALNQAHKWKEHCEKQNLQPGTQVLDPKGFGSRLDGFWSLFDKAGCDDFNTPEIFAELFNLVRSFNALIRPGLKPTADLLLSCNKFIDLFKGVGAVMALFNEVPSQFLRTLDDMTLKDKNIERKTVDDIVTQRQVARTNKDFTTSDKLRDQLVAMGIEIRDSATGTEWEVKK